MYKPDNYIHQSFDGTYMSKPHDTIPQVHTSLHLNPNPTSCWCCAQSMLRPSLLCDRPGSTGPTVLRIVAMINAAIFSGGAST